jgi:transposase
MRFGHRRRRQSERQRRSRQFPNRVPAFEVLEAWCAKHCKDESLPVRYLMESTGVYHEQIAWHLFRADRQTSVVLPNKAKHYLMSLGHKSKNDKIDARGLAQMGLDGAARAAEPAAVAAAVEGNLHAAHAYPPARQRPTVSGCRN